MRLIDADELLEHAYRDKLDSRELIANMIKSAPTVKEIPINIPLSLIVKALEQKPKTGHCRDCKYYHTAWDGTETHYYEDYWCEWVEPNENDFCSLYEAKKEVNE